LRKARLTDNVGSVMLLIALYLRRVLTAQRSPLVSGR
jgi:hypothetical protein